MKVKFARWTEAGRVGGFERFAHVATRTRGAVWLLTLVLLAAAAYAPFADHVLTNRRTGPNTYVLVGFILVGTLFSLAAGHWERHRMRALAKLLKAQTVRGYPASLQIRQLALATGDDVGVFTFEDGQLRFTGLRTSFSLTQSVCSNLEVTPSPSFTLELESHGYRPKLSIAPLTVIRGVSREFEPDDLRPAVSAWLQGPTVGPATLPPPEVHPVEKLVYADQAIVILLSSVILADGIALLTYALEHDGGGTRVELMIASFLLACGAGSLFHAIRSIRRSRRKMRDLRARAEVLAQDWETPAALVLEPAAIQTSNFR